MTNQKILEKVIKKVQKNGWYPDTKFKIVHYDGSIGTSMYLIGVFDDDGHIESYERDVETFIFQEYFAKVLWGEEPLCPETGEVAELNPAFWADCICHYRFARPAWQYHLQEMVIEEDRIKYLEKFL